MVWGGVEPADAWRRLRALPPSAFFAALGVHMGIYLLRALRFYVLIPRSVRPSYGRVLVMSSAHNLASYVLPAKTGEASLVLYLSTQCGVPKSAGLAALVVARMLDGAVLFGLIALSCLSLGIGSEEASQAFLVPLGGLLLLLAGFFALLSWRADVGTRLLVWMVGLVNGTRFAIGRKIVATAQRVGDAIVSAGGGGKLRAAAVLSVPVWLGVFAFYVALVQPIGMPDFIGPVQATFGSSLAMVSNLLPVNGMAGFGTQETGWVVGFGVLGVEHDLALETGIGVHLVQLFNVCAMGLVAHVVMGLLPRIGPAAGPDGSSSPTGSGAPDSAEPPAA